MKIALWTVGILLLVLIGGIGSCVYVVGRRVHQKFEQAKQAMEEARPAGGGLNRMVNLDACTLVTQEELAEIYKRPFAAPAKDGTSCHFKASGSSTAGVNIMVAPDLFLFLGATQQYGAHPHPLEGARSFYADGTLFLSYHALFVKIKPVHGRSDAEAIAKLVLARL